MKYFYRAFTFVLYPLLIILIFLRKFSKKEDNKRYKEKIFSSHFNIQRKQNFKLFWFHAASIGELKSILPVINELSKKKNHLEFLITTVTLSSSLIAEKELKKFSNAKHRFFPLDVNFLINRFLNMWKPDAIFLVDSEIWPNLILSAKKKKIPLAIINARITKKTFLRWNYFKSFAKEIFSSFDFSLSSNSETVNFLNIFNAKNIFFEGNLKLSNQIKLEEIKDINDNLLKESKVWVAASTHKGEETFCIKTHLLLKKDLKNVISIIAPRHINRINQIEKLCQSFNLNYQVLRKGELIQEKKEIIIINYFGNLPAYFKLASSVFVGKSLIKKLKEVGGQNPIEAAKLGCKIYHGPYIYNFFEIYKILNQNHVSRKVESSYELANFLKSDFTSENNEKLPSFMDIIGKKTLDSNMKVINKFLFHENI